MKKLILFFLLIPALINAQVDSLLRKSIVASGLSLNMPGLSIESEFQPGPVTLMERYYINHYGERQNSYAIVSEKITIGNVPTVIYRPSGFDASKKYPTFLFLHGDSEKGDGTDMQLERLRVNGNHAALLAAADKYKFIVIAPQLVPSRNADIPGWTEKYMQPIYQHIIGSPNTDLTRIIVTGLSRGGGGTWTAITGAFAPYVAAAIPICGTPQYDADYSAIAKYHIAVWAFHAEDDATVKVAATKNTIALIKKFNPTPAPIATYFTTGGHDIWGRVYSDSTVYNLALSQSNSLDSLPPPPTPVPIPTKKKLTETYFADGDRIIVWDDKTAELIRKQ